MAQEFWDTRYGAEGFAYGTAPNRFLARHADLIPAGGRVLLPADGEGRNAVYLAKQGVSVVSFDFSAVAVEKARRLAKTNGVTIDAAVADAMTYDYTVETFDAVALIFVHQPKPMRKHIHAKSIAALKPGGLILLQAFRPENLGRGTGGPREAGRLYTEADLREDFAAYRIEHLETGEEMLDEGQFHRGKAAVISMIVRK
jgi:SAM-dependent methyltransferase